MTRVCRSAATTDGHPCAQVVEDYRDHCDAGHSCPTQQSLLSAKNASLDANGGLLNVEELIGPADGSPEWVVSATPIAIDEHLAEIWIQEHRYLSYLKSSTKSLGRYENRPSRVAASTRERLMQSIKEHQAKLEELRSEASVFEEEFSRRGGWNRYFLCSSRDGHVHNGMNCSTLYPTSTMVWLPSLADKSEVEMVEEMGAKACTVCFPSAPTLPAYQRSAAELETLAEKKKAEQCPGSGEQLLVDHRRRYSRCPSCGGRVLATSRGLARVHRPSLQKST